MCLLHQAVHFVGMDIGLLLQTRILQTVLLQTIGLLFPIEMYGKTPVGVIVLGSLEILGSFSVPRHHGPDLGSEGSLVLQTFICAF